MKLVVLLTLAASGASAAAAESRDVLLRGFEAPLTGRPGDAARGRAIAGDRSTGLCLLCHSGPFPEQPLQGDLAPDLRGAGARFSEAELRLRMVDSRRINPDTIMPPYQLASELVRVAPSFRDRPILTAEELEDVVAWLKTLRDSESGPK